MFPTVLKEERDDHVCDLLSCFALQPTAHSLSVTRPPWFSHHTHKDIFAALERISHGSFNGNEVERLRVRAAARRLLTTMDVNMMSLLSAAERRKSQWEKLMHGAGCRIVSSWPDPQEYEMLIEAEIA